MKHVERAICRAKDVATKVVETISQNFIATNLIEKCPPSAFPIVKDLIRQWKEVSKII